MKTIIANDGTELQVSDCDHLFLSGYSWGPDGRGYYRCTNRGTWNGHKICGKRLHWFIVQLMGLVTPKGFEIDHIDRNKANNQRCNLRVVSKELQMQNRSIHKDNTSGFIGVCFHKQANKWMASISINNKQKHLGYFTTPEEASKIFQAARKIRDTKEIKRCEEVING